MRGPTRSIVLGLVLAVVGGSAAAVALTLTPGGGAPGSSYSAEVPCSSDPRVYVVDLDAGIPPATLVPETGTESSPGEWTFALQSGEYDQLLSSVCDEEIERSRYDVENPVLLPGPTVAHFTDWRPELDGTTVVGTDCPAGTVATATFRGPGGYEETASSDVDEFGDWEVPVPASAPAGDLTVDASCGPLTYDPITITNRGGPPTPPPTVTSPTPTDPPPIPASPAVPIDAATNLTG